MSAWLRPLALKRLRAAAHAAGRRKLAERYTADLAALNARRAADWDHVRRLAARRARPLTIAHMHATHRPIAVVCGLRKEADRG